MQAKKLQTIQDRQLMIATGHSRLTTKWKNEELLWSDLLKRLSTTTRTRETVADYFKMAKSEQVTTKDVGGFVGGSLKNGKRSIENVASRSLLTLDLDFISTSVQEVWDSITMFYSCELCIYSTHSHKASSPRLRLIIPLNRNVFADEYQAIARRVADDIGIDLFDDSTYQPYRLMFWPSSPVDGEFEFRHQGGSLLDADAILNTYPDWKDISYWPCSSRQNVNINREMKKQEDPLEKSGLVGAFCRTYSIEEVIETYLSEEYVATKVPGRYTYLKGSTVGGLVVYDGKFAYSHHGTDPTGGMLCNAFDLVRIHKYRFLDEDAKENTPINRLPSYTKMIKVIGEDEEVKKQLGLERLKDLDNDFDFEEMDEEEDLSWLSKLTYDKQGNIEPTIKNIYLILENDPHLKGKLVFDSFAVRAFAKGHVPWTDEGTHDWNDTDNSGIREYIEKNYNIYSVQKTRDAKMLIFERNKRHPVREFLQGLEWDGVKRLETIFIDYLGAEDSVYTRQVAIIQLVGAVARIMEPGIKFETMVTLTGAQGIGKSTLIAKLGKINLGWYSDSLETMKGKEAAELLQGKWHIELGELNATKKSDRDTIKAFLSRQYDVYRIPYAEHPTRFPRQCVFWGTTNDANFLRDPTGDRRTYPVDCMINRPKKSVFTDLTEEVVDQIWAEAMELYRQNTPIYLKGEAAQMAIEKQLEHKEDTPLSGLVEEYLNRKYPADWPNMALIERVNFLRGSEDVLTQAERTYVKDRVCVLEIWCELLGKRPGDLKPINSREIGDILRGLKGWEPVKSKISFGKIYGQQRGFTRIIS